MYAIIFYLNVFGKVALETLMQLMIFFGVGLLSARRATRSVPYDSDGPSCRWHLLDSPERNPMIQKTYTCKFKLYSELFCFSNFLHEFYQSLHPS